MKAVICPVAINGLAAVIVACGDNPREPGPVTPDPDAPLPPADPGPVDPTTHAELLGDWAAYPAWCSNTTGPERPITITLTRFEGYENSCAIAASRPIAEGHELDLVCQAEGQETRETLRASATEDRLRLSCPDRDGETVAFARCPST